MSLRVGADGMAEDLRRGPCEAQRQWRGVCAGEELETALILFCRKHLSPIKCSRSIDFEAELPRTLTGKLVKRYLRDRYWPKTVTKVWRFVAPCGCSCETRARSPAGSSLVHDPSDIVG
jgi:acyl-CoA synthetase (AMP-forming)/AMP-acid ligase II